MTTYRSFVRLLDPGRRSEGQVRSEGLHSRAADLAARAPVPLPLVAVVSNAGIACVNPVELIAMDK